MPIYKLDDIAGYLDEDVFYCIECNKRHDLISNEYILTWNDVGKDLMLICNHCQNTIERPE